MLKYIEKGVLKQSRKGHNQIKEKKKHTEVRGQKKKSQFFLKKKFLNNMLKKLLNPNAIIREKKQKKAKVYEQLNGHKI